MSQITKNHWIELAIRAFIFMLTIASHTIDKLSENPVIRCVTYAIIWVFFYFKMISRLIPKKIESMGNQKLFAKNYVATGTSTNKDHKSAIIVGLVWLSLNSIFFALYFANIISKEFMLILAMFFAVCDLVCILFFCPFQKWFMKNKCCNTCRIYNWDFAMMFTPLWIVPSFYNYSLVIMSIVVLIIWEVSYHKHFERFHEETNESLKCKNCKELMCRNKLRVVRDNQKKVVKKREKILD